MGLYPLNPYRIFKTLLKSQYWDQEKMMKYKIHRFNSLFQIAKKSTFYAQRYSDIDFIAGVEDVTKLAVTNKSDYQKESSHFLLNSKTKGYVHASSGSTGKPTTIKISTNAEAYRRATVMRFRSWWGLKPEDKLINFTAYPKTNTTFTKRIKNYLNPKLDVDIFSIKQENIAGIYKKIVQYKPKYFRGYVSAVKAFALLLKENNLDAKSLNLRVIILTSEILYDSDRQLVEEIFGCKIANEYGCAEQGFIAYQCPDGGMHIQEEMVLVFANSNDEIISTELHNDLSPIINYKIGDKIKLSPNKCSCGRSLNLINNVEGRIGSDDILRPDGSRMNYLFFDKMIKNLSGTNLWGKIKRFQIIQDGNSFHVYIVKGNQYSEEMSNYIINYIKEGISINIDVHLHFTDEIKPEKSGKFRIFKRIVK